jgi:hypothetical protein
VKDWIEQHKLWFLLAGGAVGIYFFLQWFQTYSANQNAADAANQAAQDEALQSELGQEQAATTAATSPASSTGSSPGLVNILGTPSSSTSTPAPTSATGTTTTSTTGTTTTSATGTTSTPTGTIPPMTPGTGVTSATPVTGATGAPNPVAGNGQLPPNYNSITQTNAGGTGYGSVSPTAAQEAILQSGSSNPQFAETLAQVYAEAEPGYNLSGFDAYWNAITAPGANPSTVSTPAYIAYEGSNPYVVDAEMQAAGQPLPFTDLPPEPGVADPYNQPGVEAPPAGTGSTPSGSTPATSTTPTSTTPSNVTSPPTKHPITVIPSSTRTTAITKPTGISRLQPIGPAKSSTSPGPIAVVFNPSNPGSTPPPMPST